MRAGFERILYSLANQCDTLGRVAQLRSRLTEKTTLRGAMRKRNSPLITAPTWATFLAGPGRSSRAINESCKVNRAAG